MRDVVECIFCHEDAVLKESERQVEHGIVKVKVSQYNYECTSCKRTFRTREQILLDGDLRKLPVIPMPNRGHVASNNKVFNAGSEQDNH